MQGKEGTLLVPHFKAITLAADWRKMDKERAKQKAGRFSQEAINTGTAFHL